MFCANAAPDKTTLSVLIQLKHLKYFFVFSLLSELSFIPSWAVCPLRSHFCHHTSLKKTVTAFPTLIQDPYYEAIRKCEFESKSKIKTLTFLGNYYHKLKIDYASFTNS
jgi:hypothetical protein